MRAVLFAVLAAVFTPSQAQASKPAFDPLNAPAAVQTAPAAKPLPTKPAATPEKPVAPATAAIPVAAAPKGPQVVLFEALENHIGKSIVIKTTMRTTRRGTLKRFNRAGVLIVDTSRGFAMEIDIPRSTVKEVTVNF